MIRVRCTVDYTLAGADLLLRRIGWSVQVPAPQAAERDEARIAAWREETWPVVKMAADLGAWLIFELAGIPRGDAGGCGRCGPGWR